VRNNDFDPEHLALGIAEVHAQGRYFYLASNLMPHGAKLRTFMADMEPIVSLGPDALIMADPGLILLVRERWPEMPIHLSVQANTVNAQAVRFWEGQGISRVILSRELSLGEIAEIRDACPDIELEVFVHGALCIAYSGRCLLSGYFNHRDANQGTCTNSCRWEYKVGSAVASATGQDRHPAADEVYLLEESERPGEYMPVFEDEHGTYVMNAKDLRAVEHVAALVRIGIDCLKIEGRTKSHYYAARTTQVYRRAIDDAIAGNPFRSELLTDLEGLANRGYTEGFYRRHASSERQNYDRGSSDNQRQIFVGEVTASGGGWAEIAVKNRFAVGDELEVLTPGANRCFRLEAMRDAEGVPAQIAPGAGHRVRIPMPLADCEMGLITRLL
jgi:putative protease